MDLQSLLNKDGATLTVDGNYGPKTQAAFAAAIASPAATLGSVGSVIANPTSVINASAYPWQDWIKKHFGEIEATGQPVTAFDKEIFSHTSCPLGADMLAGCAATMCAALEETGYKSPHNASAISFKDYGTESELKKGAILVFQWSPGEHHVTSCDEICADGVSVVCAGGNQNHLVKDSTYPRASIIAIRWPVKA